MATGNDKHPNTLNVLDPDESPASEDARPKVMYNLCSRPSSSDIEGRRGLPLNWIESVTRRTSTPTKQISVQTVQRKQNRQTVGISSYTANEHQVSSDANSAVGSKKYPATSEMLSSSRTYHRASDAISGIMNRSFGKQHKEKSGIGPVNTYESLSETLYSASLLPSMTEFTCSTVKSSVSPASASLDDSFPSYSTSSSLGNMHRSVQKRITTSKSNTDLTHKKPEFIPVTNRSAWKGDAELVTGSNIRSDENIDRNIPTKPNWSTNSISEEELVDIEDSDSFDTGLSAGEDSSLSEDEIQAPNELLMEFLTAVMKQDYETAEKLCKMILIYEPQNKDAVCFQAVLNEKRQLDEELSVEEESGDESDSSDENSSGSDISSESEGSTPDALKQSGLSE